MHHSKGANSPTRRNLLSLDEQDMARLINQFDWPAYRAGQILRWLYQRRARTIDQMTDLSKADRAKLASDTTITRAVSCTIFCSADRTKKLILTLEDGLEVEAVLIPDDDRLTLCVSTQVGCTLDCGFCLTGTMGLKRNLKSHEIIEQVVGKRIDRAVGHKSLPLPNRHRVSIGRRACGTPNTDAAARRASVGFNDDRLAQCGSHTLGHDARYRVGSSAGRDDDGDRPCRIGLRPRNPRYGGQRRSARC